MIKTESLIINYFRQNCTWDYNYNICDYKKYMILNINDINIIENIDKPKKDKKIIDINYIKKYLFYNKNYISFEKTIYNFTESGYGEGLILIDINIIVKLDKIFKNHIVIKFLEIDETNDYYSKVEV